MSPTLPLLLIMAFSCFGKSKSHGIAPHLWNENDGKRSSMYGEGPMPRDIIDQRQNTRKKDAATQTDFLPYSMTWENLIPTVTVAPAKAPPHHDGQQPTTSKPSPHLSEAEQCLGANCYYTMKCKLKHEGVKEMKHMNWFHAALEYERSSELDMPHSCRMVGNKLKCAVPMEGTIGGLGHLMTLYGMKFSVTLTDYGSNGVFFDLGLKQKKMSTLVELFNMKMIDELATNLMSYKKEIDDPTELTSSR